VTTDNTAVLPERQDSGDTVEEETHRTVISGRNKQNAIDSK